MAVYTVRTDFYSTCFYNSFISDESEAEEIAQVFKIRPIDFHGKLLKHVSIVKADSSEKLQEIIDNQKDGKILSLTLEEGEALSNALLCLMKSTNEARKMLYDVNISEKIDERVYLYQTLLDKICDFCDCYDEILEN